MMIDKWKGGKKMNLKNKNLIESIPFSRRIWLSLLNFIGEKNEVRIIATSPDYMEIDLWILRFEKGEKREFRIRGTEAYIKVIMSSLKENFRLQIEKN